jgi:hypothetical protein
MTTALQLDLPQYQFPVSRPLVPIEVAMVMTDRDEDEVLAMIEDGHLAWAWDIKSEGAERREIRIWRDSLLMHLTGGRQPTQTEDQVLDGLLPHLGAEIRTPRLRRIFTASQWLIQNLINQGQLHGLNDAKVGPNGYVRVTRASVITFLRNRRIF